MLDYDEFVATVRAAIPRFHEQWLNHEQDLAVRADPHPPTIIVAGPGAGKTTVLVLRMLKLMLVNGIVPGRIVATTFTRKAAAELRSRALSWGYAIMNRSIGDAAAAQNPSREVWLRATDVNALRTGTLDSLAEEFLVDCRAPGEIIPATIEGFLAKSIMRRHALFAQGRFRNANLETLLNGLKLISNFNNALPDKLRAVSGFADRIRHDLIDTAAYGAAGPGRQVRGGRY